VLGASQGDGKFLKVSIVGFGEVGSSWWRVLLGQDGWQKELQHFTKEERGLGTRCLKGVPSRSWEVDLQERKHEHYPPSGKIKIFGGKGSNSRDGERP